MASAGAGIQEMAGQAKAAAPADLLVHIAPPQPGELASIADLLRQAAGLIGGRGAIIALAFATGDGELAGTEAAAVGGNRDWLRISPYKGSGQVAPSLLGLHTAADYIAALGAAKTSGAKVCMMLGPDATSVSAESIAALAAPPLDGRADLAMPLYSLTSFEGLLNTAVLYPLARALFGGGARYPLAFDLAMSQRMQQKMLAAVGRRQVQAESFPWPATEALIGGLSIAQVGVGLRKLPHGDGSDLTSILTSILGSLFAEAEAKAPHWQRVRPGAQAPDDVAAVSVAVAAGLTAGAAPEAAGMVDSFRLGTENLQEVWGLVLPPNTLLALKKLARLPAAEFRLSDALWSHIVYDFLLAYRQRAISRSHLMGAFVPLYLGWVASYVLEMTDASVSPAQVERRVEDLAEAFEAEKPYLLARWRWPDRFNP
ncbi:MAG: hypothetical protein ACYCSN_08925 [Acidobacteriaceae bacterium]